MEHGPGRARRIVRNPWVGLALTAVLAIGILVVLQLATSRTSVGQTWFGNEVILATSAIVATLLVTLLIQGWTIAEAGFAPRHALRDLGRGWLAGAALMSVSVGVLALTGGYTVVSMAIDAAEWRAIGFNFFFMALVGLAEETIFRGVLFRYLNAALGSWAALLTTSVLFGASHLANPGGTLWGAAAIAIEAGVMLGAAFLLTRSLWLAIGIHWAWNFVQASVFGINVSGSNVPFASILKPTIRGPEILSGGAFGIEASIIAVIVCLGFGIWLLWLGRHQTV